MSKYHSAMAKLATMVTIGAIFSPAGTMAQQKSLKEQLVGTWALVSVDTLNPDRSRSPIFGPTPKGIVVFDSGGHYVLQLTNPSVPKFAATNRNAGTVEENKAAVAGNLAHFGTYTIDESDHSFTLRIEGSSFPNWTGAEQKRGPVTVAGDELKWINPGSSVGGSSELLWRRASSK